MKKTPAELLDMTWQERLAYLKTLPEAERKQVNAELFLTVSGRTVKAMVDNLNSHAKK